MSSRTSGTTLPVPTAALTTAGLVGGFAAARYTHNRPLGGLVWAAAGAAAVADWLPTTGPATTGGLLGLYAAAMGGSHPLAKKLGAWPSVLAVSGVTAVAAWALADRHR